MNTTSLLASWTNTRVPDVGKKAEDIFLHIFPGMDYGNYRGDDLGAVFREETDVIDHILKYHMQANHQPGKSYFISKDKNFVYNQLVLETMNRPGKSFPHKPSKKRGVRQKTFFEQVGVHGLSELPCRTVTVIYDRTNNKIITAFPTI